MNIIEINDLLFIAFSANLILSCILTITAYNAILALIALVFAFLNTAFIFFLMELEFLALLLLIVYVGAISVLFLFSVMMFNLKEVIRTKNIDLVFKTFLLVIGIFILIVIVVSIIDVHNNNYIYSELFNKKLGENHKQYFYLKFYSHFKQDPAYKYFMYSSIIPNLTSELYIIGQVLYSRYALYLGVITLINNPKEQIQMQHTNKQISRQAFNTFTELK